MILLLLDIKYPKVFPARFARRIASFYYVLLLLGPKYPKIFPAGRPASQTVGLRLQKFFYSDDSPIFLSSSVFQDSPEIFL